MSPTPPAPPLIKVCGMRDAENIREVEALGVNLMGFIFWPKSSRYVQCRRVGVFVDASIDDIRQHVADYALDMVQLHGHEAPDFVRSLHADGCSPVIVKAFNIATKVDLEAVKPYEGIVDYFLFDTKGPSVGGNGAKFDWSVLADYVGATPFLLSGGIGPDDAARVRNFSHPRCIGIDLNSCFETAPAVKDTAALSRFLSQLSQ